MGEAKGPDEILSEKIAAMGRDLGTLHFELWTDLSDLHVAWQEYSELYVKSEQNVILLNQTAPKFFYYAQRMFEHGILLYLCRLTDPIQTGTKQNHTIRRIPDLVESGEFRDRIQQCVDNAIEATGFARDHRNRRIAHKDILLARNQHPRPLEPSTLGKIRSAIGAIVECMNVVQSRYEKSHTHYGPVGASRGARMLLHYLERGVKHRDQERRDWNL